MPIDKMKLDFYNTHKYAKLRLSITAIYKDDCNIHTNRNYMFGWACILYEYIPGIAGSRGMWCRRTVRSAFDPPHRHTPH